MSWTPLEAIEAPNLFPLLVQSKRLIGRTANTCVGIDLEKGEVVWTHDTPHHREMSARWMKTVGSDVLLIQDGTSRTICELLDPETGELRWASTVDVRLDGEGVTSVGDLIWLCGSDKTSRWLLCLHTSDGSVIAKHKAPRAMHAYATSDGTVWLGGRKGLWAWRDGEIEKVAGDCTYSGVLDGDRLIYRGGAMRSPTTIELKEATGTELRTIVTIPVNRFQGAPILAPENTAVTLDGDGLGARRVDLATGRTLWHAPHPGTGVDGIIAGESVLARFVDGTTTRLHAFDLPTGEVLSLPDMDMPWSVARDGEIILVSTMDGIHRFARQ